MNYILFDGASHTWLARKFDFAIESKGKKDLLRWISGAFEAVRISKRNDIITCWYDFQALLVWLISLLTFRKRNIVVINILLKSKPTLKNWMVSLLYKHFLSSSRVKATVTSSYYGDWLREKLRIKKKFFLLHDVYHSYYKADESLSIDKKYVFCGGRNGRDWPFMIELTKSMPDINFVIVMPSDIYKIYKKQVPENVILLCDISYGSFLNYLSFSELVCLPLDTEAPAGLIVLFQAAANNRMVITTKTVTTKEYIREEMGECLPRDVHIWTETIREFINDEKKEKYAKNFKIFLETECSESKFINKLFYVINGDIIVD